MELFLKVVDYGYKEKSGGGAGALNGPDKRQTRSQGRLYRLEPRFLHRQREEGSGGQEGVVDR